MRKRFTFLSVLFICAYGAFAQTQSQLEKQIIDLSTRKFNWLIDKKYDSLESLLDDRLMYIHSNGWVQSKREVIDDLKTGKLNYVKVTLKESSVRIYGVTAIINGLGTFEGVTEGKTFAIELRFTEVYVKNGKVWMLASRHANRMP